MSAPETENPQAWKKKAAIFGAAASSLTGLGILLAVLFASHHGPAKRETPVPAPAPGTHQPG